jgi:hypothetical protein
MPLELLMPLWPLCWLVVCELWSDDWDGVLLDGLDELLVCATATAVASSRIAVNRSVFRMGFSSDCSCPSAWVLWDRSDAHQ